MYQFLQIAINSPFSMPLLCISLSCPKLFQMVGLGSFCKLKPVSLFFLLLYEHKDLSKNYLSILLHLTNMIFERVVLKCQHITAVMEGEQEQSRGKIRFNQLMTRHFWLRLGISQVYFDMCRPKAMGYLNAEAVASCYVPSRPTR